MNEKKKFKHKFIIFLIIVLIINVALAPITYTYINLTIHLANHKSSIDVLIGDKAEPASEEYIKSLYKGYNLTDQEFANLIYERSCKNYKDIDDFYYYYDKDIFNFPEYIDNVIMQKNIFEDRNEYVNFLYLTNVRLYRDDILRYIYHNQFKIYEEIVEINNQKINIGFALYEANYHNVNPESGMYIDTVEYEDYKDVFEEIILPKAIEYYNNKK